MCLLQAGVARTSSGFWTWTDEESLVVSYYGQAVWACVVTPDATLQDSLVRGRITRRLKVERVSMQHGICKPRRAAATCEGLTVECSVCFSPDITGDSASHKYPVATRVRSMPEHSSVFHTFDTHIRLTNFLSVESQTGWRVFLCHFLELCTHFSYHKYICLDNILVVWWGLGALGLPFTDIFSLAGFRRLAHGCWSDSTACVLTN